MSDTQRWIWDEKHQDYFMIQRTVRGEHDCIWAKDNLPRPGSLKVCRTSRDLQNSLCSQCRAIVPLLESKLSPSAPLSKAELLARYSRSQVEAFFTSNTKCPLCKLALLVIEGTFIPARSVSGFSLWLVNSLNADERHRAIGYDNKNAVTGICVELDATYGQGREMSGDFKLYRHDGLIMPADMSTSPYAVEKVKADAFDFTQAQRWMSLCDRTHANCRVRAGSRKIVRLTVFDCHNQTLVAHDANQPYLALSYVWGPQPETKATSGDYPRVIEDAIRATQKLGYRFLWIDRYCINQTNKEEQKAQLQQMDLIYENADLTIVAAAGQNDQYGLPGIGTRADTQAKRPPQPAATIGNLQLVSSLPDIELYLSESKWSTRGWTYQEALLSRRCLMFFTSQVYFVCQTMCRSETLPNLPQMKEEAIRNLNLQTIFRRNPWVDDTARYLGQPQVYPDQETIRHHATMFSSRAFTKDSDALYGFAGILNRATIRSYYAVPILDKHPVLGLLLGFLWWTLDSEDANRRDGHPSWSWIGVKDTQVDFRYPELSHAGNGLQQDSRLASIWVDDAGCWIPFEQLTKQNPEGKMIPFMNSTLLIEGFMAPVEWIYQDGSTERSIRLGTGDDSVIAALELDCDTSIPKDFFRREMQGKGTEALSLRWVAWNLLDMRKLVPHGALEYLVLEEHGGVYRRIGIAHTSKAVAGFQLRKISLQ